MGTIGFIGAGNMAEALIKGIIEAKVCSPGDIVISDVRAERLKELADEYGVTAAAGNGELVSQADIVVLAVKPQNMAELLGEIKTAAADKLFISFHTVNTHIKNIYKKLEVTTKAAVVSKAYKENLFYSNSKTYT